MDPQDLVTRYGEYAHGDPTKDDRRIVLDKSLLPDMTDLTIHTRQQLPQSYNQELKYESAQAANNGQSLLLLFFGHGAERTFGIHLGEGSDGEEHVLLPADIASCVGPSVDCTVVTTSCYGGGWAITPNLNASVITGAHEEMETLAWQDSESMSRACGGRLATALVQSLIINSFPELTERAPVPAPNDVAYIDYVPQDPAAAFQKAPSFAALCKAVHDIVKYRIDERPYNDMYFGAQDDDWEHHYRARLGLKLVDYGQRWRALRQVTSTEDTTQQPSQTGSFRFGRRRLTFKGAHKHAVLLAHEYMASHPGHDSTAKNHWLHTRAIMLLTGKPLDKETLSTVRVQLDYRLRKVGSKATMLKDRAGINFVDFNDFDEIAYKESVTPATKSNLSEVRALVARFDLFPKPDRVERFVYAKGNAYLAAAIIHGGYNLMEAWHLLQELYQVSDKYNMSYTFLKRLRIDRDRTIKSSLRVIGKETGKRVRDLSPKKQRRGRLTDTFDNLEIESSRES
jgi:hypothetical protein